MGQSFKIEPVDHVYHITQTSKVLQIQFKSPILTVTPWVTLHKSPHPFQPQFLICKMGIISVPSSGYIQEETQEELPACNLFTMTVIYISLQTEIFFYDLR